MRLADFIESNLEPILAEWEIFARGIVASVKMNALELRDHAPDILRATVRDMRSSQSVLERAEKSRGHRLTDGGIATLTDASEHHAVARLGSGFDLLEVVSEYRALRASILQLWRDSAPAADDRDVDDVTRFNESIDQLITMAVASYTKRVDQARDMFLAILSHDLRNPLNSISMSAAILPEVGTDTAEARRYASQISTNVTVMARMINDLLDYTRTRLGTGMPVSPARIDLNLLGLEVYNEFHSSHPDRDIRYSAAGDLIGDWDVDRVRQAISNLLGNAIQHGGAGAPIELNLRSNGPTHGSSDGSSHGSSDGGDVLIEVRNGGDPIPPGEFSKIFDPLIRGSSADDPKKNRPGSIGLGLYIAREVAKSHGGRIDVTSTAADGTSFIMRVPRRAPIKTPGPVMDTQQILKM